MVISPFLRFDVFALTDDPGTDLHAEVNILSASLTAVVPSFLGLTVTVILDELPVTLTTVDPDLVTTAGGRLRLQLSALVTAGPGGSVVFYAGDPDAFVDLAAHHGWAGLAGRVAADVDLPSAAHPARPLGVSGLTELSTYHQAIGVLIVDGYGPDAAGAELRRRADRDSTSLPDAAGRVLDTITEPASASSFDR